MLTEQNVAIFLCQEVKLKVSFKLLIVSNEILLISKTINPTCLLQGNAWKNIVDLNKIVVAFS